VTRAALGLVARCDFCRRACLESVEERAPAADEPHGEVVRIPFVPPPERSRRGQPPEERTADRPPQRPRASEP